MLEITGERQNESNFSEESDEEENDDDGESRFLPGFSTEINEFDSAFGIFRPGEGINE